MPEPSRPHSNYDPDEYPRALQAIKEMWLPPASVIWLIERAAKEAGGLSEEASMWLRRVKAARQSDTITD